MDRRVKYGTRPAPVVGRDRLPGVQGGARGARQGAGAGRAALRILTQHPRLLAPGGRPLPPGPLAAALPSVRPPCSRGGRLLEPVPVRPAPVLCPEAWGSFR